MCGNFFIDCFTFSNIIAVFVVSKRHKFLSQDLRAGLCELFASWSGRFGLAYNYDKKSSRFVL